MKLKYNIGEPPYHFHQKGTSFATFPRNNTASNKAKIRRTLTPYQKQINSYTQFLVKIWSELPQQTRDNWIAWSVYYPQPCNYPDSGNITGYQLFIKRNFYQLLINSPDKTIISEPTVEIFPDVVCYPVLKIVAGRLILSYTFSGYGNNFIAAVFLSNHISSGAIYSKSNSRFMTSFGNVQPLEIVYGNLFNGYSADNVRNIAPAGWHVPLFTELAQFIIDIGGNAVGGCNLKETGTAHWYPPNTQATDLFGFSMRGSSGRSTFGFGALTANAGIILMPKITSYRVIPFSWDSCSVNIATTQANHFGRSIRLLKNDSTDPKVMTGNDGKQYKTCKIGNYVWQGENSAETKYRDGTLIPNITDQTTWNNDTTGATCFFDNNQANSFISNPASFDITARYLLNFGQLPKVGEYVLCRIVIFSKTSGQFLPVQYVKIRVEAG